MSIVPEPSSAEVTHVDVMVNLGREVFAVTRGMRIAQMVIAPVQIARWEEVADLSVTDRAEGGFGHTGR